MRTRVGSRAVRSSGRKAAARGKNAKLLQLIRRRVGQVNLAPIIQGKQMVIVVTCGEVAARILDQVAGAQATAERLRSSVSDIEAAMDLMEQSKASAQSTRAHEPLTEGERAALKDGGLDDRPLGPGEPDPALEGAARYAKILKESLTVHEAAAKLGNVNQSRIRQRLTTSPPTLYAIKVGRQWRLPAFQFESKGTIHGIQEVIAALPADLDPVSVESWFSIPNPDLVRGDESDPMSPLEWLRSGGASARAAELAKDL